MMKEGVLERVVQPSPGCSAAPSPKMGEGGPLGPGEGCTGQSFTACLVSFGFCCVSVLTAILAHESSSTLSGFGGRF
jgi:hypothetical protein